MRVQRQSRQSVPPIIDLIHLPSEAITLRSSLFIRAAIIDGKKEGGVTLVPVPTGKFFNV
jgi:hypothetical protein